MKFTIAKCVWGQAYVSTMLEYNLPSLLAPGNLPRVAAAHEIEHMLYTTAADAIVIRRSSVFQRLAELVSCKIVDIEAGESLDGVGYGAIIDRMNAVHNRILRHCWEQGRIWLFDQPDHVWADGSLGTLAEHAASGHNCVVFPAIRTVKEQVEPVLDHWRAADGSITVDSRSLVGIALDNLHTHDCARLWGPETATIWPHHVSWRVGPGAMVRRAFYTQPFAVRPPAAWVPAERSVDMHYLDRAFPDPQSLHFIDDTDDFFVLEVSTQFHVLDANPHPLSLGLLSAWASSATKAYQRACFHRPVRFHRAPVPERRWKRVERFSERIAQALDDSVALRNIADVLEARRPRLSLVLRRLLGLLDQRPPGPWRSGEFFVLVPPEAELAEAVLSTADDDLWLAVAAHTVAGRYDPEACGVDREAVTLSGRHLTVEAEGEGLRIDGRAMTGAIQVSERLHLLELGSLRTSERGVRK